MGASSDPTLVRLWPIQEATFLRWLAQGYGYCPRRVDSGRDQQILFLWLQTDLSEISCEGHNDGKEGDIVWRDGSNRLFPTSCLISFWRERPEDSLCEGRAARRVEEGVCRTSLERRD